jgi:hypothetical protein
MDVDCQQGEGGHGDGEEEAGRNLVDPMGDDCLAGRVGEGIEEPTDQHQQERAGQVDGQHENANRGEQGRPT